MAWISTISDDDADDELVALFDRVRDRHTGRVDNIMAIHSLNPAGLAAHDGLYSSAMAGTATLRKVEREMIALVVSQVNDCHY